MNSITLLACFESRRTYTIMDHFKVEVFIERNPYHIPLDALFLMAARKNTKRGFLFVSKLLGKHIPVAPLTPVLGGRALAERYVSVLYGEQYIEKNCDFAEAFVNQQVMQTEGEYIAKHQLQLPEKTLFIGFAETATALGQAMFACFVSNARYIHTTRENIPSIHDVLSFTEEHSHAPEHCCYAVDQELFNNTDLVVLVDDEITTGKSALNFIRAIQKKYPRKKYIVVSILDWRSLADRQKFLEAQQELDTTIQVISLLSGHMIVSGEPSLSTGDEQRLPIKMNNVTPKVEMIFLKKSLGVLYNFSSINTNGEENHTPYLMATGRFGITAEELSNCEALFHEAGSELKAQRQGKRTLCVGTGEFMYIPFRIAHYMGEGISVQSTTRSPIYPSKNAGYAVQSASHFVNHDDPTIVNYMYNITPGQYDEVYIFLEREVSLERLQPLINTFKELAIPRICVVICLSTKKKDRIIPMPQLLGSYSAEDVIFLLKDISTLLLETSTTVREEAVQKGAHYSEMLPIEYQPLPAYITLFHQTLVETAQKVALAVGIVAEQIVKLKGPSLVLASLARAGTPIGILIKRYLEKFYDIKLPHYSISIIRGKGLDENAILYIKQQHPDRKIQFVDGWTGKGAITAELMKACADFTEKYGGELDPDLAVLADPGHCVRLYGTQEDFLIPSACLNSTVSGLVSRTVHRADLIGENEFHGAKYYKEWAEDDVSLLFINTITRYFTTIKDEAMLIAQRHIEQSSEPTWEGLRKIEELQRVFSLKNINLIKPGVGETTRVLLRRVPWKILVNDINNPNLQHILLLAKERSVSIEEYVGLSYSCCGLIKPLEVGES